MKPNLYDLPRQTFKRIATISYHWIRHYLLNLVFILNKRSTHVFNDCKTWNNMYIGPANIALIFHIRYHDKWYILPFVDFLIYSISHKNVTGTLTCCFVVLQVPLDEYAAHDIPPWLKLHSLWTGNHVVSVKWSRVTKKAKTTLKRGNPFLHCLDQISFDWVSVV